MKKSFIRIAPLILLLHVFPLLSGCTDEDKVSSVIPEAEQPGAGIFVIGLLPEQNVFLQKKKYRPLSEYLSVALNMRVKTKLLDSYDAVYNEMSGRKVDAAFFGSLSFVVMDSRIAIEPIARPIGEDNISTYRGAVFVRKESGITEDVRTWKGKTIALVSKSTTAGYIFPRWYLYTHGVKDFEGYFSRTLYTGSHDAAVMAVFRGDADIGSAKDSIVEDLLNQNPLMHEKMTVLAYSPPVPSNTLGILADSDSSLKIRLKDVLIRMHETPEGRDALSALNAQRFIETKKSDFDLLFDMLNPLNLKTDFFVLKEIGKGTEPGHFLKREEMR